jgi:hypothetical protein
MLEPAPVFADQLDVIPNDAVLLRRVDWDKVGGVDRFAGSLTPELIGNCFTDYDPVKARAMGYPGACMSVHIFAALGPEGLAGQIQRYPDYGFARLIARDLRELRRVDGTPCPQGIMARPTEDDPSHAVVFDLERMGESKRAAGVAKRIAAIADWEVPLIGPPYDHDAEQV